MKTLNHKSKLASMVAGLFTLALFLMTPQPAHALNGSAPIIVAITPNQAAAGFGQLVAIQGFNLFDPFNPSLTKVVFTQGSITANGFLIGGVPSNANEIFVRLPSGVLTPGVATTVTVQTSDDNLVSNAVQFTVKDKPSRPIPRRVAAVINGLPTITSAAPGQQIAISAYGIDTNAFNTGVVFTQGTNKIAVQPTSSFTPSGEVLTVVTVPASLNPGHAFVQLRAKVGGKNGNLSFALGLTIQ